MEALAPLQTSAIGSPPAPPWYTVLYIQVLIAIALGIAIGHFYRTSASSSNRWATASSR